MQRWIQRFENYNQALENIEETIICIDQNGINKIYTMALIQAFEMVFELAWKTLKDYLEYSGIKTDTPRETIKEAFANNIIANGQVWIEMMEARNKTSHTYRAEFAQKLAQEILKDYIAEFRILSQTLKGKLNG